MAKDYYGKTLDEWRAEDPATWPQRVKVAMVNSEGHRERSVPVTHRPGLTAPLSESDLDAEGVLKPRYDPEAAAQDVAMEMEARQERLTEIAYRYGDRDEKGVPYYGEATRRNLHLLSLLTLADLTLKGDVRAASDLARFTATTPELTVRHKIDLATNPDDLLTMKAQVWLGMDPSAQKAYLMRLEGEQRGALVARARELETGGEPS